ncbi:hypothetical protein PC129_g4366 [Phytophthora cactorum]|uniref:Uncharacterized protein n=1 Tax=Phytophthora cactorum TaxID=29920 RepID=A0A8T1L4D7_9STRA|nr:hypothetical protein PC114_g7497 [Phytophthora cactorum]KAG2932547.1 hypothetical protein PC117_g13126 [Phytophthora cactorum]KAG3181869.1 hypothetical protein PC128_g14950 [Phytophthora cactorum]KAG3225001.1 hypothetical protein PC129_g4366 [Phytophthora cactorum]KAG4243079.1 hypothetical protein PC116_g9032 [Phytophthora cactorum]
MGQLCAHYFGLHVSPPINGDTPAAKRVFDRVEALMRNDEWMQLFKPIPERRPTGRLSPTNCNTQLTQSRRAKSRRTRSRCC